MTTNLSDIPVVILAGGRGSRLAEESDARPKPMVEIGGQPILWHIMKLYAHHGATDFIICLGYKGYVIKEYFANYVLHRCNMMADLAGNRIEFERSQAEPWRVTLVDTGEATETGGRIKRIAPYLRGRPFCLTYGDGLADVDLGRLVDFHRSQRATVTVTAVRPPARFGALEIEGDRVRAFTEKPEGGLINGGFFVVSPGALERIAGDGIVWEREPLEGLAEAGELAAFRHTGFWQPMDTLRDKRTLEGLWASGRAPWRVWE